mgnify:CR=1 FL=1
MSIGSRDVRASTAADVVLRLRVWTRSFRLKFLPQGVLPVLLGSIVAWRETGQFDLAFFTLAIIGAACVQIGLTMLNDALDYVYGTDRSETAKENPYSGGSGVLASFYGVFLLACAVHAPIGLRTVLLEMTTIKPVSVNGIAGAFAAVILLMGMKAVLGFYGLGGG